MKVYRIETAAGGIGPFTGNGVYAYLAKVDKDRDADLEVDTSYPYRHPSPGSDPGIEGNFDSSYFCGFVSLEQLKLWFPYAPGRGAMHNDGYVIKVYETDDYFEGTRQVVFRKAEATLVDVLLVESFERLEANVC